MPKSPLISLFHLFPPEMAHHLAVQALRYGLVPPQPRVVSPALETTLAGVPIANPVGLAAGFDKNAETIAALAGQGFGFGECGTVTPLPQPGNPKPRIFRLKDEEAVVNRLGFNNDGLEAFAARLAAPRSFPIGANLGKNKDATDALADYVTGATRCYPLAQYLTVNISSPNTQGLRDLQAAEPFGQLVSAVTQVRRQLMETEGQPHKPIFFKLAPDLEADAIRALCDILVEGGADGAILSNTTITRPVAFDGAGGLSGKPLQPLARAALHTAYAHAGDRLTFISAGGIDSAEEAYARLRAGASAVQLYTALTYQGMGLVTQIKRGLIAFLQQDGFANVREAIGVGA